MAAGDSFLLYLAGRGWTMKGRHYWLPADTPSDRYAHIREHGLDQDGLLELLAGIPATRGLLFLESYRARPSWAVKGVLAEQTAWERLRQASGRPLLAVNADSSWERTGTPAPWRLLCSRPWKRSKGTWRAHPWPTPACGTCRRRGTITCRYTHRPTQAALDPGSKSPSPAGRMPQEATPDVAQASRLHGSFLFPRAAWEAGSSAPRRASGRCPAFVYPSRMNIPVSEVCRWCPRARRSEEDRRAGKRSASRRYCDGEAARLHGHQGCMARPERRSRDSAAFRRNAAIRCERRAIHG